MKRTLYYFGLEPLKSRYTHQLSEEWMPATFKQFIDDYSFVKIDGKFDTDQQIKVGVVLDAVGRGKFSMSQCSAFLDLINSGVVKDNDIVFLQDFYTPGLDSIFYALDLYGINVKFYSMLHAQSVDEYDFTFPMKDWLRPIELGIDSKMSGIFVGSTIHREQLRTAGFKAPIHVVSLPLHLQLTKDVLDSVQIHPRDKKDVVVYASRFDKEKNPFFMLEVAKQFLDAHPKFEWHITTSGKEIRSSLTGVKEAIQKLASEQPRFKVLTNLTKIEYYTELATSKILFNTSLQDYVSWTVLEGTAFGILFVAPKFRSFPEFVAPTMMYQPFKVESALQVLQFANLGQSYTSYDDNNVAVKSDIGRQMEGWIIANEPKYEINIWHELELCKQLLNIK